MTSSRVARLFDIRNVIAALLGIFGILLTLAGLFPGVMSSRTPSSPSANAVDLAVGTSANTWVGLIMLAIAAIFAGWALLRPTVVGEKSAETS